MVPRRLGARRLPQREPNRPAARLLEDTDSCGTEGDLHFLVFPRWDGVARLYQFHAASDRARFTGPGASERFLAAFRAIAALPACVGFSGVRPAGPCAGFPMNDTWVERPHAPGIVLVGDAAGYSDPIIGQGLAVSLRDARLVAQALTSGDPWSEDLFTRYADERAERMRRLRASSAYITALRCTFTREGRERRRRIFDRWIEEPAEAALLAALLVGPANVAEDAFEPGALEHLLRWRHLDHRAQSSRKERTMNARKRRIDTGEVALAVREEGEGELVLLLHGFPESSFSWRHQLSALAEAGYRAVAPDLRGFADSDRPVGVEQYAAARILADLDGLVAALGHGRAHVVGHDWGGVFALAMAALTPERVISLTMANCAHGDAYLAELRRLRAWDQARMSWYVLLFQAEGVAEEWLSADDFANLRAWGFGTAASGTFTEDDIERQLAPLRLPGALTAGLNLYRANLPHSAWVRGRPPLPEIRVPTLVVWGEADAYISLNSLEGTVARIPHARVERLSGVSHWVQQEVPEEFNRLLIGFLDEPRTPPEGAASPL